MTIQPLIRSLQDWLITSEMRSIQQQMDCCKQTIDNELGAMQILSNDMINLRHQRAALHGNILYTERRTNRIKRVLFGWMERIKRS